MRNATYRFAYLHEKVMCSPRKETAFNRYGYDHRTLGAYPTATDLGYVPRSEIPGVWRHLSSFPGHSRSQGEGRGNVRIKMRRI